MKDTTEQLRDANPVPADAYHDASRGADALNLLDRIRATPQLRRSRRPLVLAGVAAAAAVAAVVTGVGVLPLIGGGGPPPAFAVERAADGTLTVTINNFSGSWGLNTNLSEYGLRATIVEMQQPAKDCVVDPAGQAPLPADALQPVAGAPNKISIKPSEITGDTTLVFSRQTNTDTPPTLQVFAVRSTAAHPISCKAADGSSTPALTTQPVVNPNAVNGNGADSNGLTPTPTR
jgi:hypothetical protein